MSLSSDGRLLFLQTTHGVETIDLAAQLSLNIAGGAGNDVLHGSIGADVLDGGRGNDTLYGNGGDDVFDGGNGVDTAVFSSSSTAYQVSLSNGVVMVVGAHGTATLTNVESLKFDDRTVTVASIGIGRRVCPRAAVQAVVAGAAVEDVVSGAALQAVVAAKAD